jgi:hypothetical protein
VSAQRIRTGHERDQQTDTLRGNSRPILHRPIIDRLRPVGGASTAKTDVRRSSGACAVWVDPRLASDER